MVRLFKEGKSRVKISKIIGCSVQTVCNHLKRAGVVAIIVAFLFFAPVIHAATPTLIDHKIAQTVTFNNVTTAALNCTGANLYYVALSHFDGSPAVSTSDSASLSAMTKRVDGLSTAVSSYFAVGVTGNASVTATATTTALSPSIEFSCWSNVNNFDVQNGNTTNSVVTALTTGSITPTDTGALTITAIDAPAATASFAIGSSFTVLDSAYVTGFAFALSVGYKIGNSGAQNPQWTWTTASDAAANIGSFTETGVAVTCHSSMALLGAGGC